MNISEDTKNHSPPIQRTDVNFSPQFSPIATMPQQQWGYRPPIFPQHSYAAASKQKPAVLNQNHVTNHNHITSTQNPVNKNNNEIRIPPEKFGFTIWTDQIKKIATYHNKGYRTLIIMRGVPGSGKTYLSKALVEMTVGKETCKHVFSTDDFFQTKFGYEFDPMSLDLAHKTNQKKVYEALLKGVSPVIVDNTNTQLWEMEPYVREGVKNGYIIEIVEPPTPWAKNANVLATRNTHKVDLMKIRRMLERFEPDLTGEIVIRRLGLMYPPDKQPPVMRNIPPYEPVMHSPKEKVVVTLVNDKNSEKDQINEILTNGEQENAIGNDSEIKVQSPKKDDNKLIENGEINEINETSNVTVVNEQSLQKKQLEVQDNVDNEIKILNQWDLNENWYDAEKEGKKSPNNKSDTSTPKPKRMPKKDIKKNDSYNKMYANEINDWNSINSYMPAWSPGVPSTSKTIQRPPKLSTTRGTNVEAGDAYSLSYKIIKAEPRDINKYHLPEMEKVIPERRMLDKSTETNEQFLTENYRCKNEEKHFKALRAMFKNISKSDLRDIFEKCCGDVNWAVEIILDGVDSKQIERHEENLSDCEDVNDEPCGCIANYNVIPDVEGAIREQDNKSVPAPIETKNQITKPLPQRKPKKRVRTVSESKLQLKNQLEERVAISGHHYSPQTLQLRNHRLGRGSLDDISALGFKKEPCDNAEKEIEQADQKSESSDIGYINDGEEVCGDDDDDEYIEFAEIETHSKCEEKTVVIGYEFIKHLDKMFGRADTVYPQEILPLVTMPMSLLNEINALWMESFSHQLSSQQAWGDILVKEDEEFAR